MTFLPIVERELRVASRRAGTYWARLGSAGVALLVGGWIMLIPFYGTPQRLGMALFVALAVIAFIYCLMAGMRTTSDALSEEKREGTLGLLFLTDLHGYDIVLGKLAATSLRVLYGVLAIFPILAIPLLLGGVTVAEFWRVVLVSMLCLFFSLSAGILVSTISVDDRRAMSGSFGLVFLFTAGFPILAGCIAAWTDQPPDSLWFVPSPGYAAYMAFEDTFKASTPNYFYLSVGIIGGTALGFLLLACLIVRHTWQDKPRSTKAARRHSFLRNLQHGKPETRLTARRRMLTINPVYWLAGRDRFRIVLVWLSLALGAALWLWGAIRFDHEWFDEVTFVWTAAIAHTVFKLWLGSEATRRFAADRKSGALELLLSTTQSIRQIVRGQLLALAAQFAGPLLVIVAMDITFLCFSPHGPDKDWTWLWVTGTIVLLVDVAALPWVGMWLGVSSRDSNRASGGVVLRIMVLPWVLFLGFWTMVGLMAIRAMTPAGQWLEYAPYVSFIFITVLVDLFFGLSARRNLYEDFRGAATKRFATRGKGNWNPKAAPGVQQ